MQTSDSVPSPWLADVDIAMFAPPRALPDPVDVVVIGGGWMGVSVAYWLARSKTTVLLIEANRLAFGASGRNAGMMLAGATPLEDAELVRSVLHDEQIDIEYAAPGHLALASTEEVWEAVRGMAARRANSPLPIYALDHASCEDLLK